MPHLHPDFWPYAKTVGPSLGGTFKPLRPLIEGMLPSGRSFVPFFINDANERRLGTLADLSPHTSGGARGARATLEVDLHSLRKVSGMESSYLLGHHSPRYEGHRMFMLKHDKRDILIPSSRLLPALISPISMMKEHLFRPTGLDLLGVALEANGVWRYRFRRLDELQPELPVGVFERLLWFTTFPSAARAWRSVLLHAQKGVLAIDLPRTRASLSLKIQSQARVSIATSCSVTSIEPLETPHPFASSIAGRRFIFHGSEFGNVLKAHQSETLMFRNGKPLSEREWKLLRPLFPDATKKTKAYLTLVLDKFGSGRPWHFYLNSGGAARHRDFQRALAADGRWARILTLLEQDRQQRLARSALARP